jgi:crotonobetainyl-CoA:carnitine CoA-transferase CaiB-like acyl-CoA transferase
VPRTDVYRIYDSADGQVMMIAASDSEFAGLCRAFGRLPLVRQTFPNVAFRVGIGVQLP